MHKRILPLLEFFGLALVFIALAYLVGLPETDARSVPPSVQIENQDQGPAEWDRALRLPTRSDRIANYTLDVSLDTSSNVIAGWEILEWTNTTGRSQSQFPFHLYYNAW